MITVAISRQSGMVYWFNTEVDPNDWRDGHGNIAAFMNQALTDHPEDFILISAPVGVL
jgi:hypothetical protein